MAQVSRHLAAQPRHAVCGFQPDPAGKFSLSLQPIDRGHRVRNQGQQLGPQNERGLDAREPPKGLWHAPTMPPFTSRRLVVSGGILWDTVPTNVLIVSAC